MEIAPTSPTTELTSLTASTLQVTRFKERKTREVESDVKPQAVYYSPVIRIDTKTASAVIQYRDSTTGKVEREYPNVPQGVGAYQQTQDNSSEPVKADVPAVSVKADDSRQDVDNDKSSESSEVKHVDQDA